MTEEKIGSFGSTDELLAELERRGLAFPPATRVLAFFVEDDAYINEDRPTCWIGKRTRDVHWTLVIEPPGDPDDRVFPGNIPYAEILNYEKKFEWPTYVSQTTYFVALNEYDPRQVIECSRVGLSALLGQATRCLAVTLTAEMIGFGRMKEVACTVRPVADFAPLAELLGSLAAGCLPST